MPNATERKALILCAFFAGLLCAIPMVGKVAIEGSSFGAVMRSLGFVLRGLAHPTVLGSWIIGAVLGGLHLYMSYREAKLLEQSPPEGASPAPDATEPEAASTLGETPGGA